MSLIAMLVRAPLGTLGIGHLSCLIPMTSYNVFYSWNQLQFFLLFDGSFSQLPLTPIVVYCGISP